MLLSLYDRLVKLLLKMKEKLIEKKVIKYKKISASSKNNDVEVIYHFFIKNTRNV